MHTTRLTRSRTDRMIAGVAGGIARYLSVDPVLVRIVFVVLGFNGIGLLAYPLLWLLMPRDPEPGGPGQVFVAAGTPTERLRVSPMTSGPADPEQEIPIQNLGQPQPGPAAPEQRSRLLGWVLVGLGAYFALSMALPFIGPLLIPALLIGIGGWMLYRR